MLVEFTFANVRSFREQATLSLIAASKLQPDPKLDSANVFLAREDPPLDLLRVAAVYGANASGKSNVVLALQSFLRCIQRSANVGFRFSVEPFMFDTYSDHEQALLEITFLHNRRQYRYGFEIAFPVDKQSIVREWLYQAVNTKESVLFERTGDTVKRGSGFREGTALLQEGNLRRTDALFLSLLAQIGGPTTAPLVEHLNSGMHIISGLDDEDLGHYTTQCLKSGRYRDEIQRMITNADTGVERLTLMEEENFPEPDFNFPAEMPKQLQSELRERFLGRMSVVTFHKVLNREGKNAGGAYIPMQLSESAGTQKLFAFAGRILSTLENGAVLVIDEMDARFHPLLTRSLVRLFQSSQTNPRNAQLIFVTHDTNLLDSSQFRRDQIWFVEKDRFGASHLYSLADFKGVRKDASFENDYIEGRYGGIPFLGGLNRLIGSEPQSPADREDRDDTAGVARLEPTAHSGT